MFFIWSELTNATRWGKERCLLLLLLLLYNTFALQQNKLKRRQRQYLYYVDNVCTSNWITTQCTCLIHACMWRFHCRRIRMRTLRLIAHGIHIRTHYSYRNASATLRRAHISICASHQSCFHEFAHVWTRHRVQGVINVRIAGNVSHSHLYALPLHIRGSCTHSCGAYDKLKSTSVINRFWYAM